MAPRKPRPRKIGRPSLPKGEKKSEWTGLRLQPSLRDALQESADANGRSLAAEIGARLSAAVQSDHAVKAWPELREIGNTMLANFAFAGSAAAKTELGDNVPVSQWLKNGSCYDSAVQAVLTALWKDRPDKSQESTAEFFERLKAMIVRDWWNAQGLAWGPKQ